MDKLTVFYNQIDVICDRIKTGMVDGVQVDIADPKSREVAVSYIESTAERINEDVKRYIRAYRDFK